MPTLTDFFTMARLHKLDHGESLELFKYIIEEFIELDKKLATKFQYLEDNIKAISEETGVELSKMKDNVADVQRKAIAIFRTQQEEQGQNQEISDEWRRYIV